jgi:hypothetical protein
VRRGESVALAGNLFDNDLGNWLVQHALIIIYCSGRVGARLLCNYILFECLRSRRRNSICGSGRSSESTDTNVFRLRPARRKSAASSPSKASLTRTQSTRPSGPSRIASSIGSLYFTSFRAGSSTNQKPKRKRSARSRSTMRWLRGSPWNIQ